MLHRFHFLHIALKALCGFFCVLTIGSCQDFVQGVSKPINAINDADLNSEAQLPVLFSGIAGYFGQYWRFASMYLSTLSDEFTTVEGISQNTVFPIFQEFDKIILGNKDEMVPRFGPETTKKIINCSEKCKSLNLQLNSFLQSKENIQFIGTIKQIEQQLIHQEELKKQQNFEKQQAQQQQLFLLNENNVFKNNNKCKNK